MVGDAGLVNDLMRSLFVFLSLLRSHIGRATTWLPWLGVALLVVAVLAPGSVTASRLVFQSPPPEATPIPPTPTETPPAPTPVPPAVIEDTPTTTLPETAPAEVAPTEAAPESPPTEAIPTEGPVPAEGQPAQEELPAPVEPTQPPVALPQATPPAQATEAPGVFPATEAQPPNDPGAGQPVINWVKFWDTMAVLIAYPWLCCGISLLLLVPVLLLFLEIRGRRPPPMPPETLALEKKGNEE